MTTESPHAPITALTDHLELQAWLAAAELRNPSLHTHVSSLAQLRDRLQVQIALGKLEARDRWEEIEQEWRALRPKLDDALDAAGDELMSALDRIKEGYQQLRQRA